MERKELTYRRCRQDDIQALTELQEDAFRRLEDRSLLRRNSREMLAECLSEPHYTLGAFDGAGLAAVGILYRGGQTEENLARLMDIPEESLESCGNIKLIIVRYDRRGAGTGGELIRRLEEEAVRREYKLLCATVSPRNMASLRSFEKLDYQIYGTFRKYGGLERLLLYKGL